MAATTRDEGQHALMAAKKTEAEYAQRLIKIQADLNTLRNKEKQIAEVSNNKCAIFYYLPFDGVCICLYTDMMQEPPME